VILYVDIAPRTFYTWVVGRRGQCRTLTLSTTASGTCLSLVQSGFKPDQKENFDGARSAHGLLLEERAQVGTLEAANTCSRKTRAVCAG
jgi:hypothetical protein